jgi:hypothetical protein
MEYGHLARARWRLRGAWQWPAFVAMTVADAVIGHLLPPSGQTQSVVAAGLAALALNLIGVVLLSAPAGALLRRLRPDLPRVVARNYAGTTVILAITAVVLMAGIAHRSTVAADGQAMREAIARAQAFIGDRAPAPFRRNVRQIDTLEIQEGAVYRECVPSAAAAPAQPATQATATPTRRTYCVVVNVSRPWSQSVRFAGYEPNSVFGQGVG